MAVLKADPETKRKQINIIFIVFVVGFIIIQWGMPAFLAFVNQKQPKEAAQILLVTFSLLVLSALPIAIYAFRYGQRILEAGQFPLPGAKVIHDTEIVMGDAARRKAYIAIILSIIMAVAILLGGLYIPYQLYKSFDKHQIKKTTTTRTTIEEKAPI